MPFDVVFFDIGSTLIPSAQIIKQAAAFACQTLAQQRLIAEAPSFLESYLQADAAVNPPHISHIYSDARIVSRALELAGLPLDARVIGLFLCAFRDSLRSQIKPSDELTALFIALERAGVKRGIISDGSLEGQSEPLVRLGLMPHISPRLCFISEAVGCTKVHPEIYRLALQTAGVKAGRALMIGDHLHFDVAVPQSLGMKAVLLRQYERPAFLTHSQTGSFGSTQPDQVFDTWQDLKTWLYQVF